MNLSKSKYCEALQCIKKLWLEENKPEEAESNNNNSTLENGITVGQLAKELFGKHHNISFHNDLKIMIEETNKVIEKEKNAIITEASFQYNNIFCSVDILKKNGDKYEIYEVKSSTKLEDIYKEDASFQYYLLTKLGLDVTKVCVIHINGEYIRDKELELEKLFTIEDITGTAIENLPKVEENIKKIEAARNQKEPGDLVDIHCLSPNKCQYFKYCTKHLDNPNIFDLIGLNVSQKIKYYQKGITSYESIEKEKVNAKVKEQIDFELRNRKDKIETSKIKEFLETLSYPLYFLDFETFQQPIPQYEGIKPYQQIPFQYSLHYIEQEDGIWKHKEFLATPGEDPRRKLAESLVRDIPKNVCTLAYNMGFEKTVIKNLANLYPDLSEHLQNIRENIKDLMIPFSKRNYYTKAMKGKYSIKYVLPALFPDDPSLDYHNLEEIHNGSEAMSAYATMQTLTKEEQESLRNNLLRYCELDTLAMVKIYQKIKEKTK